MERKVIKAMPQLPIGTKIKSTMGPNPAGEIVGYGSLRWDADKAIEYVYLVKIASGSSSLGPACCVMSANRVEVLEGEQ